MPCGAISSIVMRLPFTDLELSKEKIMRVRAKGVNCTLERELFLDMGLQMFVLSWLMVSQILKLRLHSPQKDHLMPFRPYNILFCFSFQNFSSF